MRFGFTNRDEIFTAACAFRDAAVADGWSIKPTYQSEPVERASHLKKDGFMMSMLTRSEATGKMPGKWKYEADICIWGPDGLTIGAPEKYDFATIQAGMTTCNSCGKTGVETQRYSFAGRCCAACRPAMAKKHEYAGWTD